MTIYMSVNDIYDELTKKDVGVLQACCTQKGTRQPVGGYTLIGLGNLLFAVVQPVIPKPEDVFALS